MSRSILSSDQAAASALQRSGLSSARTALATALAGFDDPDEAREAADSVRRLTRSLVEAGQLRESPDIAAAAIAVLVASGPAIRPAAEAFAARLGEWVDGQAPRTGTTVLIIEDDPDLASA
ncbi:MAG TPA: hypothetical protein VEI47_05635, partial [Gemmatimonadales bacterium]|nr:hypothetical protein [Gemmatimonadales bacterium]